MAVGFGPCVPGGAGWALVRIYGGFPPSGLPARGAAPGIHALRPPALRHPDLILQAARSSRAPLTHRLWIYRRKVVGGKLTVPGTWEILQAFQARQGAGW